MTYNKAKTAIAAARRKLDKPTMLVNWIDKVHGVSGVISTVVGKSLPVDDKGVVAVQGGKIQPGQPRTLTWTEVENLGKAIDRLYVGANHLNVKSDSTWKRVYQHAQRSVSYMKTDGTIVQKHENTMPCHNCGVIQPLEFLQVDHHMPQAGGADMHTLKMLRALGLTTAGPSGAKGQAIASGNLGTLVANPRGRDRSYNHLVNASPKARWTTNAKGDAFLSLFEEIDALDDLARMCMNSVLNLVPLCGECNRVKSDYHRPIA